MQQSEEGDNAETEAQVQATAEAGQPIEKEEAPKQVETAPAVQCANGS